MHISIFLNMISKMKHYCRHQIKKLFKFPEHTFKNIHRHIIWFHHLIVVLWWLWWPRLWQWWYYFTFMTQTMTMMILPLFVEASAPFFLRLSLITPYLWKESDIDLDAKYWSILTEEDNASCLAQTKSFDFSQVSECYSTHLISCFTLENRNRPEDKLEYLPGTLSECGAVPLIYIIYNIDGDLENMKDDKWPLIILPSISYLTHIMWHISFAIC